MKTDYCLILKEEQSCALARAPWLICDGECKHSKCCPLPSGWPKLLLLHLTWERGAALGRFTCSGAVKSLAKKWIKFFVLAWKFLSLLCLCLIPRKSHIIRPLDGFELGVCWSSFLIAFPKTHFEVIGEKGQNLFNWKASSSCRTVSQIYKV